MKSTLATTASRTVWLSRLLLAVAVAVVLGATLADSVAAEKNTGRKPTSIAARVKDEKTRCESNGGKIQVTYTLPGADSGTATSTCSGGTHDGRECTHTKKSTVCTQAATHEPSLPYSPLQDVVVSPTGGYEDPSVGGATPGGGAGGVDPGWTSDPGSGGWVLLTSHDGGKHDKAKQRGRHKSHGRDGKRGKD
jgi:hypothetical protein